jgi:hypothetical protein
MSSFSFYWNGNDWVNVGGQGRDISVGANGQAWLVGWNALTGGFSIHRWKGTSWSESTGGLTNISVGNNQIWGIDDEGDVFTGGGVITMSMLDGAIVSLRCMGDAAGVRWLDGRTQSTTIGLAPSTDGIYTGTKWQLVMIDNRIIPIFALKCLGTASGNRWLEGLPFNASFPNQPTVRLAPNTNNAGTRWFLHPDAPTVIRLKNAGNFPLSIENLWLDGRTRDGTVGLAPSSNGVYTGTKWEVVRRQ